MNRRRRLAGAGAAALLTLGAGGACSLPLEYAGMGVGDFTTTWTVGSCHRLDQLAETDPMVLSDTSPAVPCDGPHESETFAVLPLTGPAAAPAQRPSPLWLERETQKACSWKDLSDYLGLTPEDAAQDVTVQQFLPSAPEWARGVRRIRCDALIGPRTSQVTASISRPLRDVFAAPAGARFRVCRDDEGAVPCSQSHSAELVYPPIPFTRAQLAAESIPQRDQAVYAACLKEAAVYVGVPLTRRPDLAVYPDAPAGLTADGKIAPSGVGAFGADAAPEGTDGTAATVSDGYCWVGPSRSHGEVTGTVRNTGAVMLP